MLISEISIKGFKSYGNNEQILKLNTERGDLILICGKNGQGKSVFLGTNIDIDLSPELFNTEDLIFFLDIVGKEHENMVEK